MQILPSGLSVPPTRYLAGLAVATVLVGGLLLRRRPAVNARVVTAFAPWMVAGATLYALFQADVFPPVVRPLFGSPTVYLTTSLVAGTLWALVARWPANRWGTGSAPATLLMVGFAVAGILLAGALGIASARGTLALVRPLAAVGVALVLTAVVWVATAVRLRLGVTGTLGPLVVFGHALDGVSTALGQLLGYGEQTPLSRLLLELGASAPLPVVGGGWLFVLVKLVLAVAVTYLLADYYRDDRRIGSLLLGVVAAVGLGPGAHNVVLFLMTAG